MKQWTLNSPPTKEELTRGNIKYFDPNNKQSLWKILDAGTAGLEKK